MFDDLRKSAADQSGFPEESDLDLMPSLQKKARVGLPGFQLSKLNLLGLNAFQRFVLSALLFFLVLILGIMLVMITSSALSL
jgi:hypothetical protein